MPSSVVSSRSAIIAFSLGSLFFCYAFVQRVAPSIMTTDISLMNMFVVGSGAVMQPFIGWLLDKNWDGIMFEGARVYSASAYTTALSSLLVVNIAALIGTFVLKETHCSQQIKAL